MLNTMRSFKFISGLSLAAAILAPLWQACHASEALADAPGHVVPLFPASADSLRQGFLRVINHSDRSGEVEVRAYDDRGVRFGPATLRLDANETVHFNSTDLEEGSESKGLSNGIGSSSGDWWLALSSDLDIEALSYIRTKGDGFLTSMHDVVPSDESDSYRVAFFNPGSNHRQVSRLRLVNAGGRSAQVTISGVDSSGTSPGGNVGLALPAGSARTLSARELETGAGLRGALGDGAGKWALHVDSDGPLAVMSLLESPTGHLTNLSSGPVARHSGTHRIPLFPSASHPSRQGFLRVINRSDAAGEVAVTAFDGSGTDYETLTLSLGANKAAHFNSDDLELGNAKKGLSGSTGPGQGDWWLELSSALEIEVLAYVRFKTDGFLTSMHDTVSREGRLHRVAFFNPASNFNQVSSLRLVNFGEGDAEVTITGIGDASRPPEGTVAVRVPAGGARTLTAQQLEAGGEGFEGKLWYGSGKWQLIVESEQPVMATSLLSSPTGHLTNLSTAPASSPAPATEAAFADRMAGSRVVDPSNPANHLDFLPDGRFRESRGTDVREGSYTYARKGAGRAAVEMGYEGGGSCVQEFAFTSRTAGSLSFTCDDGTAGASSWHLADIGEAGSDDPVNWMFAGHIPDADKAVLHEELEYVQGYFAEKFGVRAEGFTVLVAENYETLAPVYKDVVGVDISRDKGFSSISDAWVTGSISGTAVITLVNGLEDGAFSSLRHHLVHEYFHVLQGQLASKFAELDDGGHAFSLSHRSGAWIPRWLVEGFASYADFVYSPTRGDRRPFLDDRYAPFRDLGWSNATGELNYDDLARTDDSAATNCRFGHYEYALSFVAAKRLAETAPRGSYVEFFWAINDHPTWQQAFRATFGIEVDDFYAAFEKWLPSQIPSYDQAVIEILWPDLEENPLPVGEFLYLWAVPTTFEGTRPNPFDYSTGSRNYWNGPPQLTITYPAGVIWEGAVYIAWSDDQVTDHLLGWYKDGKLTDQREEATPIRFASPAPELVWTLPANPSELPKLESCSRGCLF